MYGERISVKLSDVISKWLHDDVYRALGPILSAAYCLMGRNTLQTSFPADLRSTVGSWIRTKADAEHWLSDDLIHRMSG